jgi:integrase/recombinase XerD
MTDPSPVRVTGPLMPLAAGFAAELSRQGYTAIGASRQLHLMAHLSRWLAEEGLDPGRLSAAEAERFLKVRRTAGYTSRYSSRGLAPLLAYLRGLRVVPPPPSPPLPEGPVEELLERYRHYLIGERGLKDRTARCYAEMVQPFLEGRLSPEGLRLEQLGAAEVRAFVVTRCPQQGTGTAKLTVTALRSLLGFLHLEGAIGQPLAQAVPGAAGWRAAGLPRGLEPAQVRSLLASCDRDTVQGRRDFAILTILVRLGLRRAELAGLGLGDIDWRAGEVLVRGKGHRNERLPLPVDVGEAIVAYLRRGRPEGADGGTVFVRVRAPHRALSPHGVAGVVLAAARRAGLGQIHAHRLRHTAATQALRGGASLPEVGQLLRHRRLQTTAIYAKADREGLRRLALPWPGGEA